MKKLILSGLLLSLIAFSPAKAQLHPLLNARLQAVLDSTCQYYNIKGASAAVLVPGVGIWKGVHGNGSDGKPLNTEMLFGIGSNTKTFTSAIMLKLVENGQVNLNDTIGKWIHNQPNISGKITVRQILNHTSGLFNFTKNPYFNDSMMADPKRIWTPEQTLSLVMAPLFKPGASWEYSNTNYIIAGIIIKQVMKQPYEVTLRDMILKPQGFDKSIFFPQEKTSNPIAAPWSMGVNQLYQQPLTNIPGWSNNANFSFAYSAGAIMQTAEENVNFWHNLYNGQIISPASFTKMKVGVQIGSSATGPIFYGLGIFQYVNYMNGHTIFCHGGTNLGYINENAVDATTGFCFSVLTNQDSIENDVLLENVVGALQKVTLQMQFASIEPAALPANAIVLNMYPNPAADYLNIKISNYKEPLTFGLYDFFGRRIMSKNINDSETSIYINDLPAGNYIARLTAADGNVAASEKLMIR